MATKIFYVTRDQQHPLYKTRMLTAGQEMPLSPSAAVLFQKMGLKLSTESPKQAKVATAPDAPAAPPQEATTAPKARTATRKRATKKAK